MNNKGFSLIELLLVLALVATVSISSILVFNETSKTTKEQRIISTYLDIQRAAKIYLDLNDAWSNEFNANDEVYVTIGELTSKNYVNHSFGKSVQELNIPSSYLVKVYITDNGNGYVDTCIIDIKDDDSEQCISDSDGESGEGKCCNK